MNFNKILTLQEKKEYCRSLATREGLSNFQNIVLQQRGSFMETITSVLPWAKIVHLGFNRPDAVILWGDLIDRQQQARFINFAYGSNTPIILAENGFLKSVIAHSDQSYDKSVSYVFDTIMYYEGIRESGLERLIKNQKDLSQAQYIRADMLIKRIVNERLTKYNNQPIKPLEIGSPYKKKILVIDQAYGDASIQLGAMNDLIFDHMLERAIKDNPNSDIIVKTHPEFSLGFGRAGYYSHLKSFDNVYIITEPINPIELCLQCDKIYVGTSQMGFEALMCGKEVHCFGLPFYSGWGLTIDYQHNPRRNISRTLHQIFHAAYIDYTKYVNPSTNAQCGIEEACDYLINKRNQFWLEKK